MRLMLFVSVLLGLLGCSQSATPTTLPTTVSTAPRLEAFFESTGGMKGMRQRLEVWSDGQLLLLSEGGNAGTRHGTGQATPEQMTELRDLINADGFKQLDPEFMPAEQCCDLMTYTIGVPRSDTTQTIKLMDGSELPGLVDQAVDLLQRLQGQITLEASSGLFWPAHS